MTALSTPRYQFQAFPFHLVEPSPWPLLTANASLSMMIGAVLYFNGIAHGSTLLTLGFLATLFAFILWFRDVTTEGTYLGDHTLIVQKKSNTGCFTIHRNRSILLHLNLLGILPLITSSYSRTRLTMASYWSYSSKPNDSSST